MKAAVLHALGDIPRYEDFPDPVPGEGARVVRVKAASIKNLDRMLADGSHYGSHRTALPAVVGVDGICMLEDGTRVYANALPPYGMMAEKTIIMGDRYSPLPDMVDDVTAAALPNPAISAWLSLSWRGKIQPGDTVLILGATGVTGKLAIQLARQMGAGNIIAAGRNERTLQTLTDLGANTLLSLSRSDEEIQKDLLAMARQNPFDIVLDYLWGRPAELLLEVLTGHDLEAEAHTTRYIQIGEMAGPTIQLAAGTLRSAGVELYGVGKGSVPRKVMAHLLTEIMPDLMKLAAEGAIRIETETIPLRDIESAWRRNSAGGRRLVVVP